MVSPVFVFNVVLYRNIHGVSCFVLSLVFMIVRQIVDFVICFIAWKSDDFVPVDCFCGFYGLFEFVVCEKILMAFERFADNNIFIEFDIYVSFRK